MEDVADLKNSTSMLTRLRLLSQELLDKWAPLSSSGTQ